MRLCLGRAQSLSHGLDEFISKQVLNILREGDADQSPAPSQEPERKTEALLLWQRGRLGYLEPTKAIFRISKDLRNCPHRASRYPDRAWWRIRHHGYRPTNGEQLRQCLGRDQLFHNWIGDA
jgi:hypothetical protein